MIYNVSLEAVIFHLKSAPPKKPPAIKRRLKVTSNKSEALIISRDSLAVCAGRGLSLLAAYLPQNALAPSFFFLFPQSPLAPDQIIKPSS